MTDLYIIDCRSTFIFDQLELEEALLRADDRNFLLINAGSSQAIVMGHSNPIETLIDLPKARQDTVPLIRRYSGGGTVIIDPNTLIISWIFAKEALPIAPFPEPLMRFYQHFYQTAWEIPGFHLIDHDFVIHDQKCGGNAQYISKDRWVHHTSFLWDFCPHYMNYLLVPERQPHYRKQRSHIDFLCRLKDFAPSVEILIDRLILQIHKQFRVHSMSLSEAKDILLRPHRKSTSMID